MAKKTARSTEPTDPPIEDLTPPPALGLDVPTPAPAEVAATPTADPPRGRQSAAPVCPYCGKPCRAGRSTAFFTYYYCPSESCNYSEKQARPNMRERIQRHRASEDFSAR